jgi:2-keto-4-pentenoate hydratase/2-oxohepta-3-ene-1,7-dioic acid hydratase in catechol pathway
MSTPTRFTPRTLVCVGRNYREHAAELGNEVPTEPLIFLKPVTTVIADGEPIRYPTWLSTNVHYEGELALVIGQTAYRVAEADAMRYIQGYTIANDVTARDLQNKDKQWTRGKGFDTFCPIGPRLVTDLDPSALDLTTRVNGAVRQQGNTRDLIFPIPQLISFITAVMTLQPGDIILTGTPAGVGPVQPGDVVEVEIAGLGVLRNPVVAAE